MIIAVKINRNREQMPNEKFWDFVEQERQARGWSYAEIERRGGKRDADGSSIYRAINKQYALTLEQVEVIARAFEMTRLQVLRKAGFIAISPDDIEGSSLTLQELFEVARKLSVRQQRDLIRMMRGLVDDDEHEDDRKGSSIA